jgi:methylenetetrahydrofolate dehydrogenase (NADP+) / methenyltetrahydrofolate cyclohydrolase
MSERGERTARILDGRSIAHAMSLESRGQITSLVEALGHTPEVRVVLVGDDPASALYARRIVRAAESVSSCGRVVRLGADSTAHAIREALRDASEDQAVEGVILQLPLPSGLSSDDVIDALDPDKDLDGIHPRNAGLVSRRAGGFAPSCAEAALQILRRSGIPLVGRRTVVIGRSNVVGRPAGLLLTAEDATVTVCHRRTRDLAAQLRDAELVVVAAGSPGLVRGDDLRPGAVVIDCGINVLADGRIVGDVDLPSVLPVASAVTPVPGGVGPVTNAVLMDHLVRATRARLDRGRLGSPVATS